MNSLIYVVYFSFSLLASLLCYWVGSKNLKRVNAILYWLIFAIMMLIAGFHLYIVSYERFFLFGQYNIKGNDFIIVPAFALFVLNIILVVRMTNRRDGD